METGNFNTGRSISKKQINTHLCIVGGGLAGTCAAVTAAREGIRVVLVQDRPVLGGNSSSEVRLWALSATAHLNNNNRFAREGGVIDEILVENVYRNKEGNPVIFDTILLEKVMQEENITLLLNTVMYDAEIKKVADQKASIRNITAFNPQNETEYRVYANIFCDASGDGILAYLAGAPFRFGAEDGEEFGENFARDPQKYGERLGHTIFFYTKDSGSPVKFIKPAYALEDVEARVLKYRDFDVNDNGCKFWWIEYGGRLDTIHDTEQIKLELWRVVYGIWDHIKNSGNYPEAENLTLEWVGTIPGKRESRRFIGEVMLKQRDIVEQSIWPDAVSVGGWSLDLHPSDGMYSELGPCDQYHSKGVYQIPYRTMFSPWVENLLLTGRIISVSHVAFGSTRVMGTGAHNGQAAGCAAAICIEENIIPHKIVEPDNIKLLQKRLLLKGQYIPGMELKDENMAADAGLFCSSYLKFDKSVESSNTRMNLDKEYALLLPLKKGRIPVFDFVVDAAAKGSEYTKICSGDELIGAHNAQPIIYHFEDSESSAEEALLEVKLMVSLKPGNYTPELTLSAKKITVPVGNSRIVKVDFNAELDRDAFVFIVFSPHTRIRLQTHDVRIPAVRFLYHTHNQISEGIGVDNFELWLPQRRPGGLLPVFTVDDGEEVFHADMVKNGFLRPFIGANCWVPDIKDENPELTLVWKTPRRIKKVVAVFDTDHDHAMESVLLGHPESEMPYCISDYQLLDDKDNIVFEQKANHQTQNEINFKEEITTSKLTLRVLGVCGKSPGAVYSLRCY